MKIKKHIKITLVIIGILGVLVTTSIYTYKQLHKSTNSVESQELQSTNKEYLKVGEDAAAKLPTGSTSEEKYKVKYDAIYQEVFQKEAGILAKDITTSDTDIEEMLNDESVTKISKVLVLADDNSTWRYYIYTNENMSINKGDAFLGYTIQDIDSPTEEEQYEYLVKSAKCIKLVDKINARVEEIMHG